MANAAAAADLGTSKACLVFAVHREGHREWQRVALPGAAWRDLQFVPLCDLSERLEEIACQAVEVMRPYFGETLPQIQVVLIGEGTLRHHQNPVKPVLPWTRPRPKENR